MEAGYERSTAPRPQKSVGPDRIERASDVRGYGVEPAVALVHRAARSGPGAERSRSFDGWGSGDGRVPDMQSREIDPYLDAADAHRKLLKG